MKALGRGWAGKRDKAKMLLEFGEGLRGGLWKQVWVRDLTVSKRACASACVRGHVCANRGKGAGLSPSLPA